MLSEHQLLGLEETHVEKGDDGIVLHPDCRAALRELQAAAAREGFDLQVASGFRSFERQRLIWNAKALGERPLHDDDGNPLQSATLTPHELLHAILRFSALPGASRHHWGSDLDVYDAAALEAGGRVELTPEEVADDGPFGPMHCWLDRRIAAGDAFGFFRPYDRDRGGVAAERWHLSYAPIADACAVQLSQALVREALAEADLVLAKEVLAEFPDLFQRYILSASSR